MMKNTNLGIKEIAVNCGYENLNNFYKYFKLSTGLTPAVYLKKTEKSLGTFANTDLRT